MQTLSQMSDQELLAWARALCNTQFTITLGKRLGNPMTVTETYGAFPPAAFDKILRHGGQRKFNDDTNSEKTVNGKLEAVNEMIKRFKAGQVGRVASEAVDPFMTIVLRVVKARVKARDEAKYKAIMAGEKPDAVFKQILENQKPEARESIMNEATEERKRQEAKAKGLAKIEIDL